MEWEPLDGSYPPDPDFDGEIRVSLLGPDGDPVSDRLLWKGQDNLVFTDVQPALIDYVDIIVDGASMSLSLTNPIRTHQRDEVNIYMDPWRRDIMAFYERVAL